MTAQSRRPVLSFVTFASGGDDLGSLDLTLSSLRGQTAAGWEWLVVTSEPLAWRPSSEQVRLIIEPGLSAGPEALIVGAHVALSDAIASIEAGARLGPDAVDAVMEGLSTGGMVYESGTAYEPQPHEVAGGELTGGLCAAALDSCRAVGGVARPDEVVVDVHTAVTDLACRVFRAEGLRRLAQDLYQPPSQTELTGRRPVEGLLARHLLANALAWAGRAGLACLDLTPPSGTPAPAGYEPLAPPGGPVLRIARPDASAGVIRAADVLSWYPEPALVLAELFRVLAPGGVVVARTVAAPFEGGRPRWDETFFTGLDRLDSPGSGLRLAYVRTEFPTAWHVEKGVPYVEAGLVARKESDRAPSG